MAYGVRRFFNLYRSLNNGHFHFKNLKFSLNNFFTEHTFKNFCVNKEQLGKYL